MPDFRLPGHLPNLRPGRRPPGPSWLPRQRRGTTPQMIGRYPDYDVFDAIDTWDEATRKVVLARLDPRGPMRFFTGDEEPTLRAFCDTALAERVERIEAQLIARASRAAHQRRSAGDGFVIPIAGGVATFAEPGSPFNNVAGARVRW